MTHHWGIDARSTEEMEGKLKDTSLEVRGESSLALSGNPSCSPNRGPEIKSTFQRKMLMISKAIAQITE
jgi:hypothetical protein